MGRLIERVYTSIHLGLFYDCLRHYDVIMLVCLLQVILLLLFMVICLFVPVHVFSFVCMVLVFFVLITSYFFEAS